MIIKCRSKLITSRRSRFYLFHVHLLQDVTKRNLFGQPLELLDGDRALLTVDSEQVSR